MVQRVVPVHKVVMIPVVPPGIPAIDDAIARTGSTEENWLPTILPIGAVVYVRHDATGIAGVYCVCVSCCVHMTCVPRWRTGGEKDTETTCDPISAKCRHHARRLRSCFRFAGAIIPLNIRGETPFFPGAHGYSAVVSSGLYLGATKSCLVLSRPLEHFPT
jgi:hypothetical protein